MSIVCAFLALLRFDATTNNDWTASPPPNKSQSKTNGTSVQKQAQAVLCPDFQELLQRATFLIRPSHIRSTTQRAFSRHFHAHLPPRTAPKAQRIVHRQKFEAGRACLGGMRRGLSAAELSIYNTKPRLNPRPHPQPLRRTARLNHVPASPSHTTSPLPHNILLQPNPCNILVPCTRPPPLTAFPPHPPTRPRPDTYSDKI